MPQGRRKVPFSGKQKKQQLIAKRQSNQFFPSSRGYNADSDDELNATGQPSTDRGGILESVQKIHYQSGKGKAGSQRDQKNKYALHFFAESDGQLRAMRADAMRPLQAKLSGAALEIDSSLFDGYDFPQRPDWSYRLSKDQLDRNETRYFTDYVTKYERENASENKLSSYFELNLETWRQLWRVLEISDIILVIVDIRYPTLMFPPALFEYVTNTLRKDMLLVLNKVDLAPAPLVLAWKRHFEAAFPGLHVVLFTTFPGYNLRNVPGLSDHHGLQIRRRRGKQRMAIEGAAQVLRACQAIVADSVDLSSWSAKVADETRWLNEKMRRHATNAPDADSDDDEQVHCEQTHADESAFDFEEHVRYRDGTLTVGCIGFPNVGKSSVLNALMGRKVVSVSKTPGHTKHFQTIYLTPNVRLCDCPGLVFPSAVPRPLQVLLGSYPIAQLRVPHAAVKYLAERVDLVRLLDLQPADSGMGSTDGWSAADLCEAWATKRGFLTAKAARPDVNRAANSILRMALEGQIAMCLMPVGYFERAEHWQTHADLAEVEEIQAFGKLDDAEQAQAAAAEAVDSDEEEDDSDEDEDECAGARVQNAFDLLSDEE